ncbi:MAG: hypothetical protein R1F54_02220 [Candidatus Zeuxoniibacter abyssi]|nr:MAG: hypothetical protein R1F54_02220 [Candidatus Persebacteraceae bacterium AB1(2)]
MLPFSPKYGGAAAVLACAHTALAPHFSFALAFVGAVGLGVIVFFM